MNHLQIFLLGCVFLQIAYSQDAKPPIENTDSRIINGNLATPGQFPWQAALFFQGGPDSKFWFCSGTIISPDWILTAAHCANEADSVLIYTAIIDISAEVEPTAIENKFIIHENFSPDSLANDIALIRLTNSLTFDDGVRSISLSSEEVKESVTVTISGWGKTRANDSSISPLLNYVNLVTISNEECQKAYGDSELILPEMVCAATNPAPVQTPCNGDSGGPVVVDFDTDNPRHVAVISFVSDTGCESGLPSGYTRTASFLDWIKEKTKITA
ncbi:hypothetical protein Zmor_018854 [Zophobas morio]|uniref:Peptidase S1 domain-containing protein n=1 Tax=Zophobas morio TaxID=2755281 RepID=A0AA38IEW4_9CUCU|nr:hypothetical protein Zmor_018854 [Zophobas morio]